jgi:hypothetical protein
MLTPRREQRQNIELESMAGVSENAASDGERGDSYVIVARLDYHGHEPELHCHASCEDLHDLASGIVKPFGVQRVPSRALIIGAQFTR